MYFHSKKNACRVFGWIILYLRLWNNIRPKLQAAAESMEATWRRVDSFRTNSRAYVQKMEPAHLILCDARKTLKLFLVFLFLENICLWLESLLSRAVLVYVWVLVEGLLRFCFQNLISLWSKRESRIFNIPSECTWWKCRWRILRCFSLGSRSRVLILS